MYNSLAVPAEYMSAQHTLKNSNRKIEPVQERQLSLFTNSHFFGTILDLRSDKMQMIKSHFIVAITIFILKVSGAKAACYWNGDVCLIYCINMDAASIMEPIEDLYAEVRKWNRLRQSILQG